jgi:hypothetical protein
MNWEHWIEKINSFKYFEDDEVPTPKEIVIESSVLLAKYLQLHDHKVPDLVYITFSGSILFEWNYGNKIKTSLTEKIIHSCYKEIEVNVKAEMPEITMSVLDLSNDSKHIMNVDDFNVIRDYYFLHS